MFLLDNIVWLFWSLTSIMEIVRQALKMKTPQQINDLEEQITQQLLKNNKSKSFCNDLTVKHHSGSHDV